MMGERRVDQAKLFYEFSLERHVPQDHLLRAIDRFVDLDGVRTHLAPFYSAIGRPSVDPELMIRMLLVGYCLGIRSERRLCEEVHLNLAYRWFCRLGLDGDVPDHSTFSKNRHGRFRNSDLLRELFESVVRRCMAEGLVGGEGFAVDASIIRAHASRHRTAVDGAAGLPPEARRSGGRGVPRGSGRGRLRRGDAGHAQVHFALGSRVAVDGGAGWSGELRLLHQLPDRPRPRGDCRRGALHGRASGRARRLPHHGRAHGRTPGAAPEAADGGHGLRLGRDARSPPPTSTAVPAATS